MLAAIALTWSVDRAAGIAALLLASSSAVLGVLASFGNARTARPAHEALSLATIVAIGIHGASFVLDPFFHPGIAGTLVPGLSPYRPVSVALGQVAGYGLVALGLTYYVRGRIGPARWKKAHRLVAFFWLLGVAHGLLTGTDAFAPWFLIAAAGPVVAALAALGARWHDRLALKGAGARAAPLAGSPRPQ